jgi:protein-disulfide isomerase
MDRHSIGGRLRGLVELVATLSIIILCGALTWSTLTARATSERTRQTGKAVTPVDRGNALPAEPVSVAGAASRGNPAARVAVMEFSDFECPYCARFTREVLPALSSKFIDTGQIRWLFRHLPLQQIHPRAFAAAEAASCAGRQGRFWNMHEALFQNPKQLDALTIGAHAKTAGLDLRSFENCRNGEVAEAVKADIAVARAVGISGTPTFLVGVLTSDGLLKVTGRVNGVSNVARFEAAIERARSAPE